MGTQSVVSVVKDGKTLVKCVAGCSNCDEQKFAELIAKRQLANAKAIHDLAVWFGFGCVDCTVTTNGIEIFGKDTDGLLEGLYGSTFNRPKFNPRWDYGTASNTYLIHVEDWRVEKCKYGDIS